MNGQCIEKLSVHNEPESVFTFAGIRIDIPVVLDSLNKELVLELATKYKISAITTRTEMLLPTVSFICEKLDLFGPSTLVSSLSNDKYLFREFMKNAEIAVPD